MAKSIAPASFALRQRLVAYGPGVAMTISAVAVFAVLYPVFFGKPSIGRIVEYIVLILIISGTALGYAAWHIRQIRAGLLPKPKQPWHVRLANGSVLVQTSRYTTTIPLGDVKKAVLVDDDSWDTIRGMESMCLVLHLNRGGRLSIPRSSAGFTEMLAALRGSHVVLSETV
jgi:hypothetical protein